MISDVCTYFNRKSKFCSRKGRCYGYGSKNLASGRLPDRSSSVAELSSHSKTGTIYLSVSKMAFFKITTLSQISNVRFESHAANYNHLIIDFIKIKINVRRFYSYLMNEYGDGISYLSYLFQIGETYSNIYVSRT